MAQAPQHHEDPQEVARAQDMWHNFMNVTKYTVVLFVFILIALAAAFVTF